MGIRKVLKELASAWGFRNQKNRMYEAGDHLRFSEQEQRELGKGTGKHTRET
jgi:hypothetical protein